MKEGIRGGQREGNEGVCGGRGVARENTSYMC